MQREKARRIFMWANEPRRQLNTYAHKSVLGGLFRIIIIILFPVLCLKPTLAEATTPQIYNRVTESIGLLIRICIRALVSLSQAWILFSWRNLYNN